MGGSTTFRLWLDGDVLEWFKPVLSIVEGAKQGGKRGYQTAINAALRKVVEDEMKRAGCRLGTIAPVTAIRDRR